jgi:membrane-associated phospholipid phosphatase
MVQRKQLAIGKGLHLFEWVMLAYALLTSLLILFAYTQLHNPLSMLWLRIQSVAMTLALWLVYRMLPCRITLLLRVLGQIALLSTWYPDTYEFNRILPNLDHVFAAWEQQLFGCQPALLFSQSFDSPVVSELLTLGYVSYYPLMVIVMLFYFLWRYNEFLEASFVLLASFFLFYVIFIFLPVAGPQYYYPAAGVDQIAQGIFPNVGNYFETHSESLPVPGWIDGIFYKLVIIAHEAGERPTAAFPSSHVGIMVVLLMQAWATKNRKFFWSLVPFGVLMFFATFYIQAHYAIDAIAGLVTGLLMYGLFTGIYRICQRK